MSWLSRVSLGTGMYITEAFSLYSDRARCLPLLSLDHALTHWAEDNSTIYHLPEPYNILVQDM